jgi:hypothetical protein
MMVLAEAGAMVPEILIAVMLMLVAGDNAIAGDDQVQRAVVRLPEPSQPPSRPPAQVSMKWGLDVQI